MRLKPSLLLGVGLAPVPWLDDVPLPFKSYDEYGLRDYQVRLIHRISNAMVAGYKRILVVVPTGGGKTHLARAMIAECIRQAFRSTFMVHRREILKETVKKFSDFSGDMGFVVPKVPMNDRKLLQMASTATLAGRINLLSQPHMLVVDEAHHSVASTWMTIMGAYPDSYIIGLTATPERLDGRGLREAGYQIIIEGPSVAELMAAGHLVSDYSYYGPDAPDPKMLHFGTERFSREAAAYATEPTIIGSVVQHYLKHAAGTQGIVFAQNVNHSMLLEQAFRRAGVKARHVDAKTDQYLRDKYDDEFRSEKLDLLLNVNLFDEGYDVPKITYVGIARISESLVFHRQALGRGMRPFEGKTRAIFCDHGGNWQRGLGLPDTPIKWSLDGHKRSKTGSVTGTNPVRQCKECFLIVDSSKSACPRCGHEFPVKVRQKVRQDTTTELIEIRKETAAALARMTPEEKAARKAEERRCRSYSDLLRLGKKRRYPFPEKWAAVKARFLPRETVKPASIDEMEEV